MILLKHALCVNPEYSLTNFANFGDKAPKDFIKSCMEILKNIVDSHDIEDFCEDKYAADALGDLLEQRIDPSYIIKFVLGKVNAKSISRINSLEFKPDITEDKTAFFSFKKPAEISEIDGTASMKQ